MKDETLAYRGRPYRIVRSFMPVVRLYVGQVGAADHVWGLGDPGETDELGRPGGGLWLGISDGRFFPCGWDELEETSREALEKGGHRAHDAHELLSNAVVTSGS